jgi:hypothetical protein
MKGGGQKMNAGRGGRKEETSRILLKVRIVSVYRLKKANF